MQATPSANSSVPGYSVITQGDGSAGIFAQSVGGGGGKGGFAISGSFSAGGDAQGNAVGGGGGSGGDLLNGAGTPTGVAVQIDEAGSSRRTDAMRARSKLSRSAAGAATEASRSAAARPFPTARPICNPLAGPAARGKGADVLVNANNTANAASMITTAGDLSYGIFAQSVGGGGGAGGFAIAGSLSTGGMGAASAVGGAGGGGNNAGNVTVNAGGLIATGVRTDSTTGLPVIVDHAFVALKGGNGSVGILAQSVGGGGGAGGFAIAGGLSLGGSDGASNTVGGGAGGKGSNGQDVIVTTETGSQIITFGDNAAGILAQSVGGGGGEGGFAIGAGGASDGKSATSAVGGKGAVGGDSEVCDFSGNNCRLAVVTVNNAASITTFGMLSNGIVAQSIGGGGGAGGFAVGGSFSLDGDASSSVGGGGGGKGGNAGTVIVINSGAIQVSQMGTIGILAQSIGGGGGSGAFAGGMTFSNSSDVSNTVGAGAGGAAGDGADVHVTNSAAITANGAQGVGILAQSVGGAGGNGGFSISGGAFSPRTL